MLPFKKQTLPLTHKKTHNRHCQFLLTPELSRDKTEIKRNKQHICVRLGGQLPIE